MNKNEVSVLENIQEQQSNIGEIRSSKLLYKHFISFEWKIRIFVVRRPNSLCASHQLARSLTTIENLIRKDRNACKSWDV